MLKRVVKPEEFKNSIVHIKDAVYPNIFDIGLEFNAPVHGTWNIVHIGLQMPESHQIYVCADNCMRGVVMTAMEMGLTDRFHSVILYEQDILKGSLEDETIEGVSDVIEKLGYHPPIIQVFTVCLHEFLGSDKDYIFNKLSERYPDITFLRCFMDPINQRTSLTPDQKLRRAMFECIKPLNMDKKIYVLGGDMPLNKDSFIFTIAKEYGFTVKEIWDFNTFNEYKTIGDGALFINNYPAGYVGVKEMAQRLGREFLYLPYSANMDVYDEQIKTYIDTLERLSKDKNIRNIKADEIIKSGKEKLLNKIESLKELIKDTEIAVDYMAHPRPFELAEFLVKYGFNLKGIWADSVTDEDKPAFERLKEYNKDIYIYATIHTEARVNKDIDGSVLAIGQKAAWFNETKHFVNQVEGGGYMGYEGMIRLLSDMKDAYLSEKDLHDIVPRKAIGLCSCCNIV